MSSEIVEGSFVRFTGHYEFCGVERHGMTGRVTCIHLFPGAPLDDLAVVEPFDGWYSDGAPAYGAEVPLWLAQLELAPAPTRPRDG
jgi:hypothetical protein